MIDVNGTNTRAGMSREDVIKRKKISILSMIGQSDLSFSNDNDDDDIDLDDVIVEEKEDTEEIIRKKYENKLGFPLSDDQFEAVQEITKFANSEYDENNFSATLCGYAGTGKGLLYDTPVLTSRGWVQIGNLSMNDMIMTPEGNLVSIMGIYHRGEQDIYKIKFSDGRNVICDGEHLWTLSKYSTFSADNHNHIHIEEVMTISTKNLLDIYKHFNLYLPNIKPQCLVNTCGSIIYDLDDYKVTFDSPIENISINKRMAFYHDFISHFGMYVGNTINVECIDSNITGKFVQIARSLGFNYKTWFCEESGMYNATMLDSVYITSIEPVGKGKTVCIKVNNRSGLFTTVDYIPTHNTTVTRLIYDNCVKSGLKTELCAPTHRAKYVMSNAIGSKANTLHSFLHLSPTLDIEKLSMDDLIFNLDLNSLKGMPLNGIVFVDECSMISDDMFDFLKKVSTEFRFKILFIGDSAQIRAVNSNDISKVFRLNNVHTLTTVHRQKNESALVPYLMSCREKPVSDFKTKVSINGSLYVMRDPKDFLRSYMREVRKSIEEGRPDNTRILCYRNARVKEFNDIVRKCIYKGEEYSIPYHKGDILMGYSNMEYNGYNFFNSSDYIVSEKPERIKIKIHDKFPHELPGWYLTLTDFYNNQEELEVSIVDMNEISEGIKREYAMFLDGLRINAIKAKPNVKRKLWAEWKLAFNSCAINDSLVYDNRVIKQKTFDYGYALSVHKSQGCTFNSVYVDLTDIFTNRDEMELRQLEYVAISRTKSDCCILSW